MGGRGVVLSEYASKGRCTHRFRIPRVHSFRNSLQAVLELRDCAPASRNTQTHGTQTRGTHSRARARTHVRVHVHQHARRHVHGHTQSHAQPHAESRVQAREHDPCFEGGLQRLCRPSRHQEDVV